MFKVIFRSFDAFQFSTALYLEKVWSENETNQNFDLGDNYFSYIGFFGPLGVQGQSGVIECISDFRKVCSATNLSYLASSHVGC